jgi:hypothetical protein
LGRWYCDGVDGLISSHQYTIASKFKCDTEKDGNDDTDGVLVSSLFYQQVRKITSFKQKIMDQFDSGA